MQRGRRRCDGSARLGDYEGAKRGEPDRITVTIQERVCCCVAVAEVRGCCCVRGGIAVGIEEGEVVGRQAEWTNIEAGASIWGEREGRAAGTGDRSRRGCAWRGSAVAAVLTGTPREGGMAVGAKVGKAAGRQVGRAGNEVGVTVEGERGGRTVGTAVVDRRIRAWWGSAVAADRTGTPRESGMAVGAEVGEAAGRQVGRTVIWGGVAAEGKREGRAEVAVEEGTCGNDRVRAAAAVAVEGWH